MSVHTKFSTFDFLQSFDHMLAPLVDAGVPTLIYAGEADYICNWMGNEAWVNVLPWKHQHAFKHTNYQDWQVEEIAFKFQIRYFFKAIKFLSIFAIFSKCDQQFH